MSPNEQIWQVVLGNLELSLSKAKFTTWFANTSILEQIGNKVTIGVPNTFTKEWLQNKYHQEILKALRSVDPEIKQVEYQITSQQNNSRRQEARPVKKEEASPSRQPGADSLASGLNPKYLFGNFIVGSNNALAHAAAQAISKNPGKAYNPLFIYGGAGLRETHLKQAPWN